MNKEVDNMDYNKFLDEHRLHIELWNDVINYYSKLRNIKSYNTIEQIKEKILKRMKLKYLLKGFSIFGIEGVKYINSFFNDVIDNASCFACKIANDIFCMNSYNIRLYSCNYCPIIEWKTSLSKCPCSHSNNEYFELHKIIQNIDTDNEIDRKKIQKEIIKLCEMIRDKEWKIVEIEHL
jgi:hypothetical protein